jgi:hypothetical protein
MGEGKYEIVTIDRSLAPRDRFDRSVGGIGRIDSFVYEY